MKLSPNRAVAQGFAGCVLAMFFVACASTPRIDSEAVDSKAAHTWLMRYCSPSSREIAGDLVVKSNTPEFKGQFPASVMVDREDAFVLEVTNILGGTLLKLTRGKTGMEIEVPGKPKLNRSGVNAYLGLDLPTLATLLRGDLPCPGFSGRGEVRVLKNQVLLQSPEWSWSYERSDETSGSVPVKLTLHSRSGGVSEPIQVWIDEWDREHQYAKKVRVQAEGSEMKWTWKNRQLR